MKVSLVSITTPAPELVAAGIVTAEQVIVHAARVSNPDNQFNNETADKLIAFLIRERHWSPFEQACFGVRVETSRAIGAQVLRHWSLAVQEFSQRYASPHEFEKHEARGKAGPSNRQGSIDNLPQETKDWWRATEDEIQATALLKYNEAIKRGVAPEQARMLFPLSVRTTMYLNGFVRDWIHYLGQRTDGHAQLEHRVIAEAIQALFAQHFPAVMAALKLNAQNKAAGR